MDLWKVANEVTFTEVKFHPEVKSQTGLSSLPVLFEIE